MSPRLPYRPVATSPISVRSAIDQPTATNPSTSPPMTLIRVFILILLSATSARADFLFTYFTKNGEDGLHLAASVDGYKWDKLNDGKSYLAPKVGKSKLMRDPSVARGPDGTYHMVWTSGW